MNKKKETQPQKLCTNSIHNLFGEEIKIEDVPEDSKLYSYLFKRK